MKICFLLLLFVYICPAGCPVFDFKLQTVRDPDAVDKNLKLEAIVNTKPLEVKAIAKKNDDTRDKDESDYNYEDEDYEEAKTKSQKMRKEQKEQTKKISRSDCSTEEGIEDFVGSNLFDANRRKCFSKEQAALLIARRDFELILPKDLPNCLFNDKMITIIMDYFLCCNNIIKGLGEETKPLIEKAFYDALGGYLKTFLLPIIKHSYYAGTVNLKTYISLETLFLQCKKYLNTNGNGWSCTPAKIINELKNVPIKPFEMETDADKNRDCCAHLDLSPCKESDAGEQMIVTLPKLDPVDKNGYLANIYLPFRNRRTFNLQAPTSGFILAKFFETVTHCYSFQHICQDNFNRRFKIWLVNNIQEHLSDEEFYPGLGAVLRIFEILRREKKSADFVNTKDDELNEMDITDDAAELEGDGAISKLSPENNDNDDSSLGDWNDFMTKTDSKTNTNNDIDLLGMSDGNSKHKGGFIGDKTNNDVYGQNNYMQDLDTFSSEDKCKKKARWKWVLWFFIYLILLLLLLLLLILLIRWLLAKRKQKPTTPKKAPPPAKAATPVASTTSSSLACQPKKCVIYTRKRRPATFIGGYTTSETEKSPKKSKKGVSFSKKTSTAKTSSKTAPPSKSKIFESSASSKPRK
ncbi:uncharacterized protein LOC119686069 isoform X1 [Teleopsis dalmanni]|uniref:uncharacterized protein LOC119686069 isoform X1 n=1 Tax=Teleopsis dalmanni TaxID=139649 RepID=UPI0018CD274D|nr:uncharacterized protein LOC119686069 isoform X1 [Teleopsis dalmanni]